MHGFLRFKDLRDLNKKIKGEDYQIPKREEIASEMAGARYFSKQRRDSGKSSWMWKVQNTALSTHLMADSGFSECHLA